MCRQTVIVFYDGWCSFCQKSVARLRNWDRRERLVFKSFRDPDVIAQYGLDAGRLEKRMHTYEQAHGRVREGINSVLVISKKVPRLWGFVPLLWLSSVMGVGQFVYDQIAARRIILPTGGCEEGACQIPTAAKKEEKV